MESVPKMAMSALNPTSDSLESWLVALMLVYHDLTVLAVGKRTDGGQGIGVERKARRDARALDDSWVCACVEV